jgi:hypothetical protein
MESMNRITTQLSLAILLFGLAAAQVQLVSPSMKKNPPVKQEAVTFLFPEQVTVPVGKPTTVALHFRVAAGLHINSHTPSDEFLIPTTFSIPEGAAARLDSATYPQGTTITLPADPNTKISAYLGEFVIQARIVATAGNHLVEAKLRYQACDQTQCLPPKTIPVAIDVIGK